MSALRRERDGPLLRVTLARPDRRNAFDAALIRELTDAFADVGDARAVILAGDGPSFCAGADVEWQRSSVDLTYDENVEDATRLLRMLQAIDGCPAPVVCRVHGYALGGGSGLVACADVAIAAPDTVFGFSEVKLGIIPAVISPFVLARIGAAGRRLFVTGESSGNGTWHDYVTVAYDTRSGQQLWTSRYEGLGGNLADEPNALAVSPDGSLVVVTGGSEESAGASRWATVAYDAATGAQRWATRYAGTPPPSPIPGDARPLIGGPTLSLTGQDDEATALAFAPDGGSVYVTGYARAFPNATDYVTVAYRALDGAVLWDSSYDGPTHRHDGASSIVVGPAGDRIYVTGNSGAGTLLESRYTPGIVLDDAATVAYDAAGNQLWAARYDGGDYLDEGSAIATGAGAVYVTGMAGWIDQTGDTHVDPVALRYAA